MHVLCAAHKCNLSTTRTLCRGSRRVLCFILSFFSLFPCSHFVMMTDEWQVRVYNWIWREQETHRRWSEKCREIRKKKNFYSFAYSSQKCRCGSTFADEMHIHERKEQRKKNDLHVNHTNGRHTENDCTVWRISSAKHLSTNYICLPLTLTTHGSQSAADKLHAPQVNRRCRWWAGSWGHAITRDPAQSTLSTFHY